MLVLIDESGDPGFKLARGSSSHFIVAMVIFADEADAELASASMSALRVTLKLKTEFRFSKAHNKVKDEFFNCFCRHKFLVRALVVDKSVVYSDDLRERKELFYSYFVRLLLHHDNGVLTDARIKIDGSGDRAFKKELNGYLRQELDAHQVKSIKFADSRRDNLIQLADMVSGAIFRSYCGDKRKTPDRWLNMLKRAGVIDDIWDFK